MGAGQVQPVSAGLVERRDMRVLVSAIGSMQARATAVVRTKVTGELEKVLFTEGQQVRAGQLLAQIDARSFQASLQQAQGQLLRDQALLKNAQLDLQRYQELKTQNSIASQQVDTQEALVRQYQGTVAADQAQVNMARLQLSYTRITAPISGLLGLRHADVGNVVNPSDANGVVTITQTTPIDAVFSVPEAHVQAIAGQLQRGQVLPVGLWDRDMKAELAQGRLSALDNAIDSTTGTVKAKAAFDNPKGQLFANQFVNVQLQVGLQAQALTVPASALQNGHVYLVQDDGTVQRRNVQVGVTDGDRVSVRGDLRPGQQVVTDGLDRLREGSKVKVIAPDAINKIDQAVRDSAAKPRGPRGERGAAHGPRPAAGRPEAAVPTPAPTAPAGAAPAEPAKH